MDSMTIGRANVPEEPMGLQVHIPCLERSFLEFCGRVRLPTLCPILSDAPQGITSYAASVT